MFLLEIRDGGIPIGRFKKKKLTNVYKRNERDSRATAGRATDICVNHTQSNISCALEIFSAFLLLPSQLTYTRFCMMNDFLPLQVLSFIFSTLHILQIILVDNEPGAQTQRKNESRSF